MDLLHYLLEQPPLAIPIGSARACFEVLERLDVELGDAASVDRAAAGGFRADRLGYAFLAGYRAALARLDPTLSRASLCASEVASSEPRRPGLNSAHPRAIATTLRPDGDAFVLNGEKSFATLASAADTLLVVASAGERDGRNQLQIARIPSSRAGVTVRDRDAVAFAPEIPHARVTFDGVRVAPNEILAGDGYERVLKPFRTIEDIHVAAAWLGHAARLARAHGADPRTLERALAALLALRELGERDPLDPATHVALAGVLADATAVASECTLGSADEETRARWQRDLPLLAVAGGARELRREAAHRRFGH